MHFASIKLNIMAVMCPLPFGVYNNIIIIIEALALHNIIELPNSSGIEYRSFGIPGGHSASVLVRMVCEFQY